MLIVKSKRFTRLETRLIFIKILFIFGKIVLKLVIFIILFILSLRDINEQTV